MSERFKPNRDDGPAGDTGAVAASDSSAASAGAHPDRTVAASDSSAGATGTDPDRGSATDRSRPARTGDGSASRSALETARTRQRDEFGGINWGASFFGWLVAVGVA
ncbi:MAG: hypothetical protein H0U06_07405, partial [Solirubrobacterales bacterium]|nr:hypothetical protein [Solirubrobacterales bacterium]